MFRPGLDRRTQDVDDSLLIAPVSQQGNKIRDGTRVAGFDPEGFSVGGDGPILIAPDGKQVAQDVILPGVAGPSCDCIPGRGNGLVQRFQPLFALLSSEEDRAQATDVPSLRRPQFDQARKVAIASSPRPIWSSKCPRLWAVSGRTPVPRCSNAPIPRAASESLPGSRQGCN